MHMIFLPIPGNPYVSYIKIIPKLILFDVLDFSKKIKNGPKYVLMHS